MEKTIEDLKLEADTLGIQYSAQIGAAKLQAKIDLQILLYLMN